jgi:hypothetical protein
MKSQYVTDRKGRKVGVILPIRDYEKMLEQLEELEDIKVYDKAVEMNEEEISVQEAFQKLESKRHDL